jgi:cytochrome c556
MNQLKKRIIIVSTAIALSVIFPVNAEHHEKHIDKKSLVTFKDVMQGLLSETKMITQGIILEDFTLINDATESIINHPKPAMSQRKKLMKTLGDDIAIFKGLDHIVHSGAMKIQQAAKDKNMVVVIAEYQKLITGCQSCHSTFKAKLSKALL